MKLWTLKEVLEGKVTFEKRLQDCSKIHKDSACARQIGGHIPCETCPKNVNGKWKKLKGREMK